MVPMPQIPQSFSPVQPDQMFRWNGVDGTGFGDAANPGVNSFTMLPTTGPYGQAIAAPSTVLARRQSSRALVPTASRAPFDRTSDNWNGYGEDPAYLQAGNPAGDEHDNIERLEEMAQRAKRDAQAKRKQIPPFVQKLSRYATSFSSSPILPAIR
jgi:heat shock transcription factor